MIHLSVSHSLLPFPSDVSPPSTQLPAVSRPHRPHLRFQGHLPASQGSQAVEVWGVVPNRHRRILQHRILNIRLARLGYLLHGFGA